MSRSPLFERITIWTCDSCKQPIQQADHGWVEWLQYASSNPNHGTARDLRLVHHITHSPVGGCQFDETAEFKKDGGLVHDLSLNYFLSPDGLTTLLVLLDDGHLPKESVIEMIRRLHTPGYEKARGHFEDAANEGVFEPNMKPGFFYQSQIEAVNEWLDS